jgi:serine/threonine protein kinase
MSDSDDYARLMAAFDEIEDASPSEREAKLEALRAQDPALAESLEELLDASAGEPTPLEDMLDVWGLVGSETFQRQLEAGSPPRDADRPLPMEVGDTAGTYRLTEVIGQGGMGCVYRAVHTELGRTAAIKVLEPHLTEDAQYVSRFLHEAKIVSALKHPNIVEVFDFVETEDPRRVAFVMELLTGSTLTETVAQRALTLEETLAVGLQLCSALQAVHAEGVVHRDLKPDNVMVIGPLVGAPPSLKLLDFGIAKVPDPAAMHQTATGAMMGTPRYMAPEQFAAEPPTPATDVYALAGLLYEALTRKPAFAGRGLRLMRRKMSGVPPELELPNDLRDADTLRALFRSCLETHAGDRPSLADVERELSALREPGAAASVPRWPQRSRVDRPARTGRGLRGWGFLAAFGALALGLAAWAVWPARGPAPTGAAIARSNWPPQVADGG